MKPRTIQLGMSCILMSLGSLYLWRADWRIFAGVFLWTWGMRLETKYK